MSEMVLWLGESGPVRKSGGVPPPSLVGGYKETSAGGPLLAIFLQKRTPGIALGVMVFTYFWGPELQVCCSTRFLHIPDFHAQRSKQGIG